MMFGRDFNELWLENEFEEGIWICVEVFMEFKGIGLLF